MTPAAYRGIKEVMYLRQRVLLEIPKDPPPSEHECHLRLIDGVEPRLQGRPLTVNPNVQDDLGRIINDKLERSIIEKSKSPFSSTVLLLPKPKGGIRFVLDYRALKKCLVNDAYTLPRVDETTTALKGANWTSRKLSGPCRWPKIRASLRRSGRRSACSSTHAWRWG
jgi:hypothetical protein